MAKAGKAILLILTAALALAVLFPVWFAVTGAVSAQWELEEKLGPVLGSAGGTASWTLLPLAPGLASLVDILMDSPSFFVMFWNTVKITGLVLAGQLLTGVPAAWGLARFDFPGKRLLLMLYLVLMLMPFQALMFPEYLVLSGLKLLDTHLAVILPAVFSAFPVFLMYRFFTAIPEAVLEAARVDGAGRLTIFLKIGLPLGAPGVMSSVILNFLDVWNLIEQPMTFLKTRSLWPLSLFLPEIGLEEAGCGFAAAVLMLVPALLLFLSGQEYLEQGIAAAALKE